MLTPEENDLITRVGPGTAMGEVMRRYWLPVTLSAELPERDCPPIRVQLLGEKLVAFRDTKGQVGLLEEFCAHRGTSLFLGRNEEGGLRCIYHGWKYDVDGNCLDQPNEPADTQFMNKIRLKAYPTVELGGIVWGFLGPRTRIPALPQFEWTQVPESHRYLAQTWQDCNWLQALEGGIDSSHSSFLHRHLTVETTRQKYRITSPSTRPEVELTNYGFVYASMRPLSKDEVYTRVYQYVMPFHTFFAQQIGFKRETSKPEIHGHIFVPIDDENCMVYNLIYSFGQKPLEDKDGIERYRGRGLGDITPDFHKVRNKDNNWLIDRQRQRTENFSGIEGINTQDHAVQESMGSIVNRTREHLGSSDTAIIKARRLLIDATKTVMEGGEPPGIAPTYYRVRAIEKVLPSNVKWQEAMRDDINPPLPN